MPRVDYSCNERANQRHQLSISFFGVSSFVMFLSSRNFATFRVFFFTCVRRRRKMKPSSLSTKISSTTCERFGKSKAQQIERLQKSSQRTGREGKSSNCRSSRNETEKKILGKTKNEAEDKEPFKKVRSDPRAVATPSARERHYFPSTARFQTLPYSVWKSSGTCFVTDNTKHRILDSPKLQFSSSY